VRAFAVLLAVLVGMALAAPLPFVRLALRPV